MDVKAINLADVIESGPRVPKKAPPVDFSSVLSTASPPGADSDKPSENLDTRPASSSASAEPARDQPAPKPASASDRPTKHDDDKPRDKHSDDDENSSDASVAAAGAVTNQGANATTSVKPDGKDAKQTAAVSAAQPNGGAIKLDPASISASDPNAALQTTQLAGQAPQADPNAPAKSAQDLLASINAALQGTQATTPQAASSASPGPLSVKLASKDGTATPSGTSLGVQAALLDDTGKATATADEKDTPPPAQPAANAAATQSKPNPLLIHAAGRANPAVDGTPQLAQAAAADASQSKSAQPADIAKIGPPTTTGAPGTTDQPSADAPKLASPVNTNPAVTASLPTAVPGTQPAVIAHNTIAAVAAVTAPAAVDQVALHIAKAASDGIDRIEIELTPPHLGRIEVHLEVGHDGHVQAAVAADRRDTLDLLQRDSRGLERALQNAGLRADAGGLSFNLRDQGNSGYQAPPFAGRADLPASPSPTPASASAAQLPNYVSSGRPGGIDIRI